MIGLGKQSKGLYYLMPQSELHPPLPTSYQVSFASGAIWHKRLGHPSKLPSQFLSKLIPSFICDSQHSCDVCPLAKQTRLSFLISSIQSILFFFYLIHYDI
jgi:hypothetical protein